MFERIDFEGLPNTRDLGGIVVASGRRIKPRLLVRSGALSDATPADLQRLADEFRVRAVVDFRTPEEVAERPDPAVEGAQHIAMPVLQTSAMGITHEERDSEAPLDVGKQLRGLLSGGFDPEAFMTRFYRNAVLMDSSIAQYRHFCSLLAPGGEGAVLWHCTMGKDRAGIATALVLLALGAPRETIVADYLATNGYIEHLNRRDADRYARKAPFFMRPALRRRLIRLFSAKEAYLEAVFDAMEQRCGSTDAFLERELGLTDAIRAQMLDFYTQP